MIFEVGSQTSVLIGGEENIRHLPLKLEYDAYKKQLFREQSLCFAP
jgi:hypothetical protein